jgi:hypothetical protein
MPLHWELQLWRGSRDNGPGRDQLPREKRFKTIENPRKMDIPREWRKSTANPQASEVHGKKIVGVVSSC